MSKINLKMKNLVEISSIVAGSINFFEIKDLIVDKMLEVVHPTKACINLFYNNDYNYAYLVCSQTLGYINDAFGSSDLKGVKLDFYKEFPSYIHQSVEEKKVIYIKDIYKDERAKNELELAQKEGYTGRIVFPLLLNEQVAGFMTCFLNENDELHDEDINFISSVASLISLSIEITDKNKEKNLVINKLRNAMELISEATKKLHLTKNIDEFLLNLSDLACKMTNSEEAVILIDTENSKNKIFKTYCNLKEHKINSKTMVEYLISKNVSGLYDNNLDSELHKDINSYIFYRLTYENEDIGVIVCTNGKKYIDDDLNMLSILSKQVTVAMQLYGYSEQNIKHKLIAKELNILNTQQKLMMNDSKMDCNEKKQLEFYHKSATVVGGDFYYSHKIDEDRVAYIVADVMGHGIVANYMVAMIKGAFKTLCYQYKTSGEISTYLNKILYEEFDKMGVFATCLISVFDVKENIISISNAGHYSPIFINKDGQVIESLNCKKGIPIGVLPDGIYHDNTFDIKECPMIFMFTDGILEIKNKYKEEYGLDRLKEFVMKNYKYDRNKIIENLKGEIEKFSGNDNFEDDILIVMLKDK